MHTQQAPCPHTGLLSVEPFTHALAPPPRRTLAALAELCDVLSPNELEARFMLGAAAAAAPARELAQRLLDAGARIRIRAHWQRRSPPNMQMLRALNKPMVLARWAESSYRTPDVGVCSNSTPVSHSRGHSRRCSRGAAEGPGGGAGGGRRRGGLARAGSAGDRGGRHHRHERVLLPVRAALTGRPGARQLRRVL